MGNIIPLYKRYKNTHRGFKTLKKKLHFII